MLSCFICSINNRDIQIVKIPTFYKKIDSRNLKKLEFFIQLTISTLNQHSILSQGQPIMSFQLQNIHQEKQQINSMSKPVQKIYNAFENILMKYESTNTQSQHPPPQSDNLPKLEYAVQLDQKQNTHETSFFFKNQFTQKQQQNNYENDNNSSIIHMQKLTGNGRKTAKQTFNPKQQNYKQSIKTTNKRKSLNHQIFTFQQKQKLFQSNPIREFLNKEKQKSKKSIQDNKTDNNDILFQQSDVQEVNIQHIKTKKQKNKQQKGIGQKMKQVKPYIQIPEDKSLLTLLNKKSKITNKQKNIQMKQVKFQIVIQLLPNQEVTQDTKKNKIMTYIQSLKKSNETSSLSKSCLNFNSNKKSSKGQVKPQQNQFASKLKIIQSKLSKKKEACEQSQLGISKQTDRKKIITQKKNQSKQIKNEGISYSLRKSAVQKRPQSNNQKSKSKQPFKIKTQAVKSRKSLLNLRNLGIKEIVHELFTSKLLQQDLYQKCLKHYSIEDMDDFRMKFQTGKLHKFNFDKNPFTPLDHRRLSEILVELFPFEYVLGQSSQKSEIHEFIQNIYELNKAQYVKLYTKIDKISKTNWWNKIQIQKQQYKQSAKLSKKNKNLSFSSVYSNDLNKQSKNKVANNQLENSFGQLQTVKSNKKRSRPVQNQQNKQIELENNRDQVDCEQQTTPVQLSARKRIKFN